MGKPRDLANVVATGNILADGAVAPAELTGVTSTAAEINILDGVTATAAELNLLDGVTATTAELNHVDGVTSNVQTQMDTKAPVASPTFTGTATAPTVNASTALQIGGVAVTATAAELNKMDGVTVSASDINSVTTKAPTADPTFTGTATAPTINASTALQIGGAAITSTAAELNILDGVTATAAELNYVDGVTSNVQTQINTKAPTADPTFTGTLAAPTINATTAIQAGGTNVITSSRQLANIASIDSTTVAALNAAGVGGGGGIELTAAENVVEGDTLAMDFSTGKVKKISRVGGLGSSTGNTVYSSADSQSIQMYDLTTIPSIGKIAVLGTLSNGNTVVLVGEVSSTGSLTWGTSWSGDSGGNRSGAKLVYDVSASRLVAIYKKSNGDTIGRLFSISGNNVTNEGATTLTQTTVTMSENETQIAAVYSPTHQRIIVAWCRQNVSDKYRITVGNVSSSSIAWASDTGPNSGYLSNGGTYIKNVGIAVNGSTIVFCGREASSGTNFAYAATMSGSTLSFGSGHSFNIGNQQNVRGQVFHVSHSAQNSNRFAYGGQDGSNDSKMYHFDVSGTTISNASNYTLNGSSGTTNGFAYGYDPANNRTYVFNRFIYSWSGDNANNMQQSNDTGRVTIHASSYQLIRACEFDSSSGYNCLIGNQNPTKIYRQALQEDNYHFFIGTALEAASANNTVKIATVGNIGTGFSGLTAGHVYKINYTGAWQQHATVGQYNYAFAENQRARSHMVALTSTTGLITNSFSTDL